MLPLVPLWPDRSLKAQLKPGPLRKAFPDPLGRFPSTPRSWSRTSAGCGHCLSQLQDSRDQSSLTTHFLAPARCPKQVVQSPSSQGPQGTVGDPGASRHPCPTPPSRVQLPTKDGAAVPQTQHEPHPTATPTTLAETWENQSLLGAVQHCSHHMFCLLSFQTNITVLRRN